MAKRNRRRDACYLKPIHFVTCGGFALLLLTWLLYSIFFLRADQVSNEIKRLEQTQREQNASLVRVTAVWNQMTEPQRLGEAIARKGLVMSVAKPERQIRVPEGYEALVMNDKLRRELASLRQQSNEKVAAKSSRKRSR
ncbi:MAG: hypothetical protein Q4C03_04585 [bacterium]|nr:hypothetical protein [bacterium]MDO5462117.1 hypothetical protein [bacterium]